MNFDVKQTLQLEIASDDSRRCADDERRREHGGCGVRALAVRLNVQVLKSGDALNK